MGKYITLQQAKDQLNVEQDYTLDDSLIESLIDAAEDKVARLLCLDGTDGLAGRFGPELPSALRQAVLLDIGTYYANREGVSTATLRRMDAGVEYLVALFRDYTL